MYLKIKEMKKIVYTTLCILLSSITFAQNESNFAVNQLIVKFKSNSSYDFKNCISKQRFEHNGLDLLNNKHNIHTIVRTGNKKKQDTYLLEFKSKKDINQLIQEYQNTELFEYVEPNFIGKGGGQKGLFKTTPNDLHFSRQYGLDNDGSFTLSPAVVDADIDMDLGWDLEQGDQSIIVAVLDAGVKLDHPEFSNRIWVNSSETLNSVDDDNNGYVDDNRGWDFVNNDNIATDDHGHGTNVAGIIGANANNNIGYAGVDWNCKLMICKILNQNNIGYYSWWSDAIYYAVDNGANVLNMSVGGTGFSNLLKDAIDYAYNNNVTVVACMMNEDNNVTYYPAGFVNTIAVGSTDANDQRSSPFFWNNNSGSNYGNHIDVVAPGNYVYGLNYLSNTDYSYYWGGTSQATPLVAGLSALLLAQDLNRTPNDIRTIIRSTSEDQVGNASEDIMGFDFYYGHGRINAYQALLLGITNTEELDVNNEQVSIFPNPSSTFLFVESEMDFNEVSILNMLGIELLKKVHQHSEVMQIDISNLPKGHYIINVMDQDGKVISTEKLIKK